MRAPLVFRALLLLTSALCLHAQVEPELKTITDLSDVYKRAGGKATMIAIYDFTPPSRGVFEDKRYLTERSRDSFILGPQGAPAYDSTIATLFAGMPKTNLGYAMTVTQWDTYRNLGKNFLGTDVDVRLYAWPATLKPLQQGGVTVRGALMYTDGGGNMQPAYWNTDVATTLAHPAASSGGAGTNYPVTHVRFQLTASSGTRTVDLPMPWKLIDSPASVLTSDPNYQRYARVFGADTIVYDKWSELHVTDMHAPINVSVPPNNYTDTFVGQFFYTADYLAFVFGGKCVANGDRSGWTNQGAFAIPDASSAPGWANKLPVMTRYQATKVASIDVFVDKKDGLFWDYRYLAPWYPGQESEEEGTSADSTPSSEPGIDPASAASSTTKRRDLRPLVYSNASYGLKEGLSSLQNMGPDNVTWDMASPGVTPTSMWSYNNGTFKSVDPVTPEPVAYALANTYRMIERNRSNSLLFGNQLQCPGKVYVIPFMTNGPNDSQSAALDQAAAAKGSNNPTKAYVTYYHGNTGNMSGNYAYGASVPGLYPGSTNDSTGIFHPGVISSVAAHGTPGALNTSNWDAPWSTDAANPFAVQTMVISLAVPGSMKLGSTNDGRNPHEQMFAVAQWGDPARNTWHAANGGGGGAGGDTSIVVGGQVYYFPANDPQELEKHLAAAANFIVSAGAALSAPATPATGVRNADEAYFGTFITNPINNSPNASPTVWAGNLYSIGLDRSTGVFLFYGNQAGDTIPPSTFIDTSLSSAFDQDNLWSAYKIFNVYQNRPNPQFVSSYSKGPGGTGVLGSGPLSWRDRRLYILNSAGNLERFKYTYSKPPVTGGGVGLADTTQLDKIIADINSGTQVVGGPVVTQLTTGSVTTDRIEALNFMRWLLGAFDPSQTITSPLASTTGTVALSNGYDGTFNRDGNDITPGDTSPSLGKAGHVNIMGDIINSSPLSVELAYDIAKDLTLANGSSLSSDPWFSTAYNSTAKEPHTRLIMVGTNTGQLHCFVEVACKPLIASGAPGPVQARATELWGFAPPNLMPLMYKLYQDYTAKVLTDSTHPHLYALDGDPTLYFNDQPNPGSVVGDTRVGRIAGEDAVVIVGMRKGGRDYFGLKIADGATGNISPDKPKLVFRVDALGGRILRSDGSYFNDTAIKHLGMGTAVPSFATVQDSVGARKNVVFISGGYSNAEIEANYQKKYGNLAWTTGRLILALDPLTGYNAISGGTLGWDFSNAATNPLMGSIPGGVTPVQVVELATGYSQRLYFADTRGNVWAINSDKVASNNNFRLDSSDITSWITSPRLLFSNLDKERFTNTPDAFRLSGDYPVLQDDGAGGQVRPLTVMVSVGSGDRNNPIDADESFINPNTTLGQTVLPPTQDHFYVFADLQNRQSALDLSKVKKIDSSFADGQSCFETPLQDVLTPGNISYLWKNYFGYYYDISASTGSHPYAYNNITYDKMMISPLIKDQGLFYSFFSVQGSSGFACSAFAQTRTYRLCDLMKPLYFDPRIALTAAVNKDNLSTANDSCGINPANARCSGLAFSFNSLSSQLVDAGDYVMQGGAKSSAEQGGNSYSQNTPDIQSVRNVGKGRGFRIRSWRVVR
ncbi:MAG TPA: hypothetical protein VJ600_10395 [Holophagaceae bacterium]|nr:hypothetical protein [Holophagaceae bacterium]